VFRQNDTKLLHMPRKILNHMAIHLERDGEDEFDRSCEK
jgi:hypothetical protein